MNDNIIDGEVTEDSALAVTPPVEIGLLRDPDQVLTEAHKAAAALGRVIAGKKRKVEFNGKQFLEVEDWVLLGQFYGVSGKTEWTRPVEFAEAKGWEARVVIIDQRTGNEVGGAEAMCLNTERNWKGKDDFQLRSMAQTRALSKALSGRLRWIPVLAGYSGTPAEEMTGQEEVRIKAPTSAEIETRRAQVRTPATNDPLSEMWQAAEASSSPQVRFALTSAKKMLKERGYTTLGDFLARHTPEDAVELTKILGQPALIQ